jgi:hypothetical protein
MLRMLPALVIVLTVAAAGAAIKPEFVLETAVNLCPEPLGLGPCGL